MTSTVLHGDCIELMAGMPADSIDAIITDPPYGLGFMGKAWDDLPPGEDWARECLRVLKPGGHILAFGGTRTWHRLAVAIEDAGFEIRDSIAWLYGSGFPKSLDVSKAIDKASGAKREVVGVNPRAAQQTAKNDVTSLGKFAGTSTDLTAPATDAARQWQGWGTALKPAFEPVVMGRKPFPKGHTVAANVQTYGTGALNFDGCRIGTEQTVTHAKTGMFGTGSVQKMREQGFRPYDVPDRSVDERLNPPGRWPANVALDTHTANTLDTQSGTTKSQQSVRVRAGDNVGNGETLNSFKIHSDNVGGFNDSGGASRFFYVAKAPARERPKIDGIAHPTVKPLALMRWLIRLVTPPGGTILDPFAGSGTTGEAAELEGFDSVLIEREADYLPLIQHRLNRSAPEPVTEHEDLTLFDGEAS